MKPNLQVTPAGKQQGAFTLIISLILLVFISLIVASTSKTIVFGLKTANNQYYQTQAQEAAAGGADYAATWLTTSGNSLNNWVTAASSSISLPADLQAISSTVQVASPTLTVPAIGSYTPTVNVWRLSSNQSLLEIRSVATSNDATASVRQIVTLGNNIFSQNWTAAPLIIKGCIADEKGNPSIIDTAGGTTAAIVTTASSTDTIAIGNNTYPCTDDHTVDTSSHLSVTGSVNYNTTMSSAWNYVFSISQADMQTLATQYPNTVYYYSASNPPPNNWQAPTPSAANGYANSDGHPIIVVFDHTITPAGCPKLNGTVYGVVYFDSNCSDNGWGGAAINGSLVSDGNITQLNANTALTYSANNTDTKNFHFGAPPSKIIGSWRDF